MRACIFTLVVVTCASAYAQQDIPPPVAPKVQIPLGIDVVPPVVADVVPALPSVANPDVTWRYRNHNGKWWYWLPANRWVVWNGSGWEDYVAPTYSVEPTYNVQPHTTYYRYDNDTPYYGGYGSGGYGYNGYGNGRYYSPGYNTGIYLGGQSGYGYGYGNSGYGYRGYGRSGYGRGGRW